MTADTPRTFHHFAEYHRPRFYRHPVAHLGVRVVPNYYGGTRYRRAAQIAGDTDRNVGMAWIGLGIVIGRYAYCVKWADAGLRIERPRA